MSPSRFKLVLIKKVSAMRKRRTHENIAVKIGPKFAYPNGVRSKYEKVYLIVILASGAPIKLQTAP